MLVVRSGSVGSGHRTLASLAAFAFALASGVGLLVGTAAGCDDSSSGAAPPFGVDAGFGLDAASFDSGHPLDDASAPAEAGVEPTASVPLPGLPVGILHGAASSDGSAIVVVSAAPNFLTWSHYEVGSGWSTATAVPGATNNNGAALAIDGHGNAFLAWTTSGLAVTALDLVRYDHATQAWSGVQHPDAYAQSFAPYVAISANASGEALLLGLRGGATGPYDVYARHYAGGTWTQELVGTEATAGLQAAFVKLADSGRAIATWYSPGGGGQQIALRSTAGVWTKALVPGIGRGIDATINESGDAIVGWEDSSYLPVAYTYDASTTTWTGPKTLSAVTESSKYGNCSARVGIGPTGDGLFVRCFGDSGKLTLESYAFTKSGNAWGTKTTIVSSGSTFFPSLGFDATGGAFALWLSSPDVSLTNAIPMTSTFTPGTGWSPESAALGGKTSNEDAVLVAPNGRAFATWLEGATFMMKKIH